MRLILSLMSCVLMTSGLQAQAARSVSDETAVRQVIGSYAEAREQRNADRLASILTPDADQLVSSGEWRRGRDELVRGMLASSERNSGARTIQVEKVRFIAPDIAIADCRYEIGGGGAQPARHMWSTFIVSRGKGGVWKIEAIRNMLPAATR